MLSNVHLTPQLVQAVRDAVRIEEIAGDHTRLKRAGQRASGLCPLHKEKTPSFSVDVTRGLFYCFGCAQGGDAIRLHMLLTGDDFPAAIESLAQRYGIPLPERRTRRDGSEEPDLEPVLQAAEEFFRDRLKRSSGPRDYLEKRQIPAELIERFRLGYAPDAWRELRGALTPGFPLRELEAAGLLARSDKRPDDPYDRFRNRLIFPIRNMAGRLVGFGGRALGADDKIKYLNTAETSRFRKGTILYGLDSAKREIRERGRVLLTEGYFDVLGAVAAGIDECVASMGTALTAQQCRLMARFADEVVIGYDGDEAGVKAARRALPLLLAAGLAVRRAEFGEGHDPDSLRLDEGADTLKERVEESRDFVAVELERLIPRGAAKEPQVQARAARATGELLKPISDRILRYGYVRIAAARLGVPDELLWSRLSGKGGETRSPPEGEEGTAPAEIRLVRSTEEQVVQLLLAGRAPLPERDQLPPPEAFHDAVCRNIYRVFLELYSGEAEDRPAPEAILDRLGSGDDAVDQVARVLLEERGSTKSEDLEQSLRRIRRRWQQRRLRELSAEIGEAQHAGDGERLRALLDEKTALSRRIHGASE